MKRLRNKLNTQIELTSLLDVIFIVLMIVICSQQLSANEKKLEAQTAIEEAQATIAEAEDAQAEVDAEKTLFENHREMYEDINSQMSIVTVYADYTPSSPSDRFLYYMFDTEGSKKITLTSGNETEAFAQLDDELSAVIEQAGDLDKPVLININTDRILYRDEKRLSTMLDDLFARYDNIYYKQGGTK